MPELHFRIAHPKKPSQNIARKKMIAASINANPQITGMPTANINTKISNKNRHILSSKPLLLQFYKY